MSQQYMELKEWCTLINDECDWNNCEGCPNNTPILTQHEENILDCDFVRELTIHHMLPAKVNRSNTIAKVQQDTNLVAFIRHFNLKKVGYSPINLKQYPMFFMLKKTLALGIPHKIYAAKDMPCIVIYENDVYLIAPRIKSEYGD